MTHLAGLANPEDSSSQSSPDAPYEEERPEHVQAEVDPGHQEEITGNSISFQDSVDVPGKDDREDAEDQ